MCHSFRPFQILLALTSAGVIFAHTTYAAAPAATPAATVKKVAIVADANLPAPAHDGIQKLEAALRDQGLTVSEDPAQRASSDLLLLLGLADGRSPAATALADLRLP